MIVTFHIDIIFVVVARVVYLQTFFFDTKLVSLHIFFCLPATSTHSDTQTHTHSSFGKDDMKMVNGKLLLTGK